MNVLIVGCGDLGTEVGLRLADAGHRVTGLRRSAHLLPSPIAGLAGDLTGELPELPGGSMAPRARGDVEVVVLTAAADERTEDAYRRAYLDGPARVLDRLAEAGVTPARVLLVTSTAVYGDQHGGWVDEATPTEPSTETGAVLVAAERALHDRAELPTTIALRLAGVYGPGRTRLIDQVRAGRATIPSTPSYGNRIHRDDAARAIITLCTELDEVAETYVGVDHAPVDKAEVLAFLADELGLARPEPAAERDRGTTRGGTKRARNDRLVATGFTFTYPTYREGYRAVLAGEGTRHR